MDKVGLLGMQARNLWIFAQKAERSRRLSTMHKEFLDSSLLYRRKKRNICSETYPSRETLDFKVAFSFLTPL